MRTRFGADPNNVPPLIVIAWARRLRGNPSGSQVVNGSFVGGSSPALAFAGRYASCVLNTAWPAGVIAGTGSGLFVFIGPTHAPVRSRLGAGPGGFGIFGTPSAMKPGGTTRPLP